MYYILKRNMRAIDLKKNNLVIALLVITCLLVFTLDNEVQASEYYTWPGYTPTVAYDYQDEYGTVPPPTQICPDGVYDDYTGAPVSTYIDRWWCFRWGSNANPLVTEDAWVPMLERFKDDFDYITNIMRWPRDLRAREGYYSTVYLFGSGLSTDDASNTDLGGWQGSAGGYPMVIASYYPVYSFDPACPYDDNDRDGQMGAMIHEGIHAILADMPGCKNSGWFHEGGNTWLQGTMEGQRSGNFSSIGWLSAGAAIAPFMPIECYSGWLQDGSFGGPSAEGVNLYEGSQQICTWRKLLGGTQYGECFPHALEVILGPQSVAWLWRNCHYSGRVLQDLAEAPGGLGDVQIRRLIQEYRARQAFCDFGQWSYAFRQLLNDIYVWGVTIQEEWSPYWIDVDPWTATCYVATTKTGNVLTPEDRTLPGWSGANQIPLTVNPSATEATVTFNPIGTNMSCQLVYRDTSGDIHYGVPVSSGVCSIPLANVMNNVIVAVICNTDYIYVDDTTRTTKYNYTLTMGAGITGTADIYEKWFDYDPASYTITGSAGANGSISPSGGVSVIAGDSQIFTFTPDSGYKVDEVLLNGVGIGRMNSYTINNVRGNMAISATFNLIGADEDPPTPNPAQWASLPVATGSDTITMKAMTGSDASGPVEYYFEETSGNPGGSDSGWQLNPTYTDTGLSEMTLYTYKVWMRDSLGNKGSWSTSKSAASFTGVKNVAAFALLDTSYVSPHETLEYINDGYTPTDSADDWPDAYGNWPANGNWNWVEYDFGTAYQIDSTEVYWWRDYGGILQPTDAYIEYWDGSAWINAGNIGTALDQWNTLVTDFITSKIRINMVSADSTGILEWRVWGQVNQPPSFIIGSFNELNAAEGTLYSGTIADDASDPESDPMTFSEISGPTWLSVASDGTLSGVPDDSHVGSNVFTVRVTGPGGIYDTAQMTIDVANTYSGTQGLGDLLGLAEQWLTFDCGACNGADLDEDNDVTLADFSIQAQNWLRDVSLQVYLKFDEISGTTASDSSIYQRSGQLVNSPVWTTDGGHSALDFDGIDDYVEITGYKGITGTASRTFSAWVKVNNSQANGVILSWGSQDAGGKWIVRVNSGGQLRAEVQGGNIIGTTIINDGAWHHIAVILDDDGSPDIIEADLYVDGELELISASVDEPVSTAGQQNVEIGTCTLGSYTYFDGLIDDVRIYDVALSQSEVGAIASP